MKQAIFVVDVYKKGTTECIGFMNISLEHAPSVSSGKVIQMLGRRVDEQGKDLAFKIVDVQMRRLS